MYTNIFDTHSHYADKLFNKDRMELLASLPENGVTRIMLAGCKVDDCTKSIQLAEQFPFVWCAVGIHPNWVNAEHETRDLEKITAMTSHEKVKAIGEIGLDYYRKDDNRELQKRMFCEQLELAKSLDLPVILHIRDAMADGLEIVKHYQPKGVVHCWSGAVEMAKEFVKLGLYLGFGGVVTYENARRVIETLQWIPPEFMLLETDCPYLPPVPFRRQRCDSRMIPYTVEKIAEIRNTDPQEIIDICCENGKRLFQIP
ncbi:MAG: TatD family hydrolase [Oscillospiraceae bacterium]